MPTFSYSARETVTGREIHNMVDAASEQAAIAALLNRNMLVLSIQEKVGRKGKTKGGKVSLADLVVFTRQLATMIDAGIAIVQSLQALADQSPNKVMRDVIKDVCTRVESGESFSEALQKHPKAFNRLYVAMVAAGETGGLLAEILARLATYLETTNRLRKKVKTAMMYPTAVTTVAICITVFLLVKVIPVFKDIYTGFGAKLPGPTQFLIGISDILSSGTRNASSCPSSAPSRTRSASPVSPALWPRSSAAACRFWTCCRLFPKPSATQFWKRPSRPPPATSSAAKAFPRRWPNTPFSPA
jgi:type IV pilus assembly protein PilC